MEVDERELASEVEVRTNEHFSASDADLCIQSSDGVQFRIHRKNLEANTGAFAGPEFSTRGEVVHLTEPAEVLEIVFQFIYPRKYPELDELDFAAVAAVAEAVEKYEVFSAMKTCEVRLRLTILWPGDIVTSSEFLPKHATQIFLHAVKHDSRKLMDKAACHLLSRPTWYKVSKKLPSHFIIPWIHYQNAWRSIFEEIASIINGRQVPEGVPSTECQLLDVNDETGEMFIFYCRICRAHSLAWLSDLEGLDTLPGLKEAALSLTPRLEKRDPGETTELCEFCKGTNHCGALPALAKRLRARIDAVPPFTTFLPASA